MKRILLITFLSVFIFKVYGQDNIGTPYSVYGIGLQTENANKAVKKADTPVKTADTANIWTGLLLMASSAATAAGIGAKRLNKNKNKQ